MSAGRIHACAVSAVLTLTLLPLFSAENAGDRLSGIEAAMKTVSTLSADFVQEKKIKFLRHNLVIKGTFHLDKAGRMAWRVNTPIQYCCVIEKDRLTQWDADSNRVISIDTARNQMLKSLVDSMGLYFSGAFMKMADSFDITFPGPCMLKMVPRKGNIAVEFITSMTVTLSKDLRHVSEVRIEERNGDLTHIVFSGFRINTPQPEKVWQAGP